MEIRGTINKAARRILTAGVEKLNRRAARLGVAPVTLEFCNERIVMARHYSSPEAKANGIWEYEFPAEVVDVVLVGEAPKLQGWDFIGRIERLPGTTESVLVTAPGNIAAARGCVLPKTTHTSTRNGRTTGRTFQHSSA